MTKEFEFETYLKISSKDFGIYLLDKGELINLYSEEIKFNDNKNQIDLNLLSKFLEDNIFKIEKFIGKFIKNIILIIDSNKISFVDIGIKKKIYEKNINKIYLENVLTEAKDLIKETNQNQKIIHILVKNYIIDGVNHSKFNCDMVCDNLCLEIEFILIQNNITLEIEKILEKYQIKAIKYIDYKYLNFFFKGNDLKVSEMAYKIHNGINENEVLVVPKNYKKQGFFEKFFQLFS
tara:strand:+ start:971 stop:1675 length:705 start_codon:yes stop_codon:yes gene_type:complete